MSLITPDFGLLVWMTLIFGIVFFILAKFGFPLITGMVDKRAERINGSIGKAREAEERLESIAAESKELIEKARLEQSRILKEASETRAAMIEKAREEATAEAAKILDEAKTRIAAEKESAIKEIRHEVAVLSVEVAEKIVRKDLSDEAAQAGLLDRLLDETFSERVS